MEPLDLLVKQRAKLQELLDQVLAEKQRLVYKANSGPGVSFSLNSQIDRLTGASRVLDALVTGKSVDVDEL